MYPIIYLFFLCMFPVCITSSSTPEKSVQLESSVYIEHPIKDKVIGSFQAEDKVLPISQNGSVNSDSATPIPPTLKKNYEFILEGGGSSPEATAKPTTLQNEVNIIGVDDTNHPKGSKGRKGVHYPGSTQPRKGVDQIESSLSNKTLIHDIINPISTKDFKTISKNPNMHSTENQNISGFQNISDLVTPHKKPQVVSDSGDTDDFDKYSIIKTSTTGEDYVIIGIVIVIGIWFSVFGALIFYRRAGEYWDRRHYRRMDFLVEGMYND